MIEYVGYDAFDAWLEQTPLEEMHVFNFLEFFGFTHDDFRVELAKSSSVDDADYILSFAP